MNPYQILLNYTYDDYLLWEGRWEIINGIAYAMSTMPNPKHQRVSGRIHSIILSEIDIKKKCPMPIIPAHGSQYN